VVASKGRAVLTTAGSPSAHASELSGRRTLLRRPTLPPTEVTAARDSGIQVGHSGTARGLRLWCRPGWCSTCAPRCARPKLTRRCRAMIATASIARRWTLVILLASLVVGLSGCGSGSGSSAVSSAAKSAKKAVSSATKSASAQSSPAAGSGGAKTVTKSQAASKPPSKVSITRSASANVKATVQTTSATSNSGGGVPWWGWVLIALGAVLLVLVIVLLRRGRGSTDGDDAAPTGAAPARVPPATAPAAVPPADQDPNIPR
jgi:hypothetical protein